MQKRAGSRRREMDLGREPKGSISEGVSEGVDGSQFHFGEQSVKVQFRGARRFKVRSEGGKD